MKIKVNGKRIECGNCGNSVICDQRGDVFCPICGDKFLPACEEEALALAHEAALAWEELEAWREGNLKKQEAAQIKRRLFYEENYEALRDRG